MAVKHKVVEPRVEARLTIILRVLQTWNAEHGDLKGLELAKLCETIVSNLGIVSTPKKNEDYMQFMSDIESVQEILAKACSNEEQMYATLKALYEGISNTQKQPSPTMSIVLQLIDIEFIPTAVKWILHSGYPEQSLEQALLTLCNWLCCWTCTSNLGPLVLYFMQGLEAERHYDILVEVTLAYIERLFRLLILPVHRNNVGPVVMHMLSSMQHNPEGFHKIIPYVNNVLKLLHKEDSESSCTYLQLIVNLSAALMDHFPGYDGIYRLLRQSLEPYTPMLNYKQTLNCKSWSDESNTVILIHLTTGKVGLNNLGNTCYMNSVLQALFMTKLFRNAILKSNRDAVPLFTKLQKLFALLQHSQKSSLSPSDILNLARPPGFQPGHQHDSSEFLGYLLDILHEQEKSVYLAIRNGDDVASGSNLESTSQTIVQHIFGGHTVTTSRCGDCGTQSERADNFRELQLSFPSNCDNQSVQMLLDYYLQPERLCGDNQYHCDRCRGLTDGDRVTRVMEPPSRLVLTLKHFRYDPASQQRTKLLQRVKLDANIHLGRAQYELYAAVVHCGSSVDSGHYYTFARDTQEWYKFNDCVVAQTTTQELCNLRPPETPYILFYNKRDCADPDPVPRSALSPQLEAAIVRDHAEIDVDKRRRSVRTYTTRQNRDDEPPPPGCGGGGFKDSVQSRFVC